MLRYLLDTNIVIEVLRRKPAGLRGHLTSHQDEIAVSSITVTELFYGVARSARPDLNGAAVESFLSQVTSLDFDMAAARHAGELRAELAAQGQAIGPYDVLIAGHAKAHGLIVVTNNRGEFDRVSGLEVEDWSEEP